MNTRKLQYYIMYMDKYKETLVQYTVHGYIQGNYSTIYSTWINKRKLQYCILYMDKYKETTVLYTVYG